MEGRLMVRKASLKRGQKLGQICWGTEPQECRGEDKTLIFNLVNLARLSTMLNAVGMRTDEGGSGY